METVLGTGNVGEIVMLVSLLNFGVVEGLILELLLLF